MSLLLGGSVVSLRFSPVLLLITGFVVVLMVHLALVLYRATDWMMRESDPITTTWIIYIFSAIQNTFTE